MMQGQYVPAAGDADRELWSITLDMPSVRQQYASGSRKYQYDQPPWLVMPANAQPFQKFNSILLPANNGLDYTVTSFTVPQGYFRDQLVAAPLKRL